MEYFSSLDYNPDTTSDFSTQKWNMIFPTQFVVNNHIQEFWLTSALVSSHQFVEIYVDWTYF